MRRARQGRLFSGVAGAAAVALAATEATGMTTACSSNHEAMAPLARDQASPSDAGPDVRASDAIEARVAEVLAAMTLDEKLAMMAGRGELERGMWASPGIERLGVTDFLMTDGPRGVGATQWVDGSPQRATAFPVGMARGATFDADLEERVGEAMGAEVRAWGGNVLLAPVVNVLRHPAWGRAQETYGEDPAHLGVLGAAFVRGAQRHVIANPKHYAVNDIEDTRFTVSIELDERTLREVFLSPFERTVRAGALSIMSAYNRVGGTYASEHPHLIRDILFDEWGFRGFVESDWILAVRSTVPSAKAGLSLEMPSARFFTPDLLRAALDSGELDAWVVDDAVRRLLRARFTLESIRTPDAPPVSIVGGEAHAALALEAARKSIVLLRNEGHVLPLAPASLASVAVVGTFAGIARLGDDGSSKVVPGHAVTPIDGIRRAVPGVPVLHLDTDSPAAADEAGIAAADAAIVVVGLSSTDEGENIDGSAGDRKSLALPAAHAALVKRVAALNPRTVVVVEAGSAVTMRDWNDLVPGILLAWYPGQEGGTALADVLFGTVSPSGKLPLTIPTDASQLPPFDATSDEVSYGYLHGYRHVDHEALTPQYAFGFGLSYATFSLDGLALAATEVTATDDVAATVTVTNTGGVTADEVVQLYVGHPGSTLVYGPRELHAFTRVTLAPDESRRVELRFPASALRSWDAATNALRLVPSQVTIAVGTSSRDLPLEARLTLR